MRSAGRPKRRECLEATRLTVTDRGWATFGDRFNDVGRQITGGGTEACVVAARASPPPISRNTARQPKGSSRAAPPLFIWRSTSMLMSGRLIGGLRTSPLFAKRLRLLVARFN